MFNSPDPFIWVRDQLLPPGLCVDAINRFEKDSRVQRGVVGVDAEYMRDVKRSDDLLITKYLEDWEDIDSYLSNVLQFAAKEYVADLHQIHNLKIFDDNHAYKKTDPLFCCLPTEIPNCVTDSGFQFQRTRPHDRYDWHSDEMIKWEEYEERQLTYIFYLNDITEGGETEFMNGVRVEPRAGRLVIFPSTWTYVHRGRPPLGEVTKYIATGWIYKSYKLFITEPPQIEPQVNELEEETEEEDGYEAPLTEQELTLDLTKLT